MMFPIVSGVMPFESAKGSNLVREYDLLDEQYVEITHS